MIKLHSRNALAKLTLAAGTAALALAPVAASAGTRAGDNSKVYASSVSEPGKGRSVEGEKLVGGIAPFHVILALVIGGWATTFVAKSSDVLFDDDDEEEFQSTGV